MKVYLVPQRLSNMTQLYIIILLTTLQLIVTNEGKKTMNDVIANFCVVQGMKYISLISNNSNYVDYNLGGDGSCTFNIIE